MKHINWKARRDEHTKNAIDFAYSIDFPVVLLVIYYPDMAAMQQPPCHYLILFDEVTPVPRKTFITWHGVKVLYMPNGSTEVVWQ